MRDEFAVETQFLSNSTNATGLGGVLAAPARLLPQNVTVAGAGQYALAVTAYEARERWRLRLFLVPDNHSGIPAPSELGLAPLILQVVSGPVDPQASVASDLPVTDYPTAVSQEKLHGFDPPLPSPRTFVGMSCVPLHVVLDSESHVRCFVQSRRPHFDF